MEDAGSGGQDDIADMVDGDSGRGATENGFGEGTSSAEAAGGTDPAQLRSKGEQTASSFWRCCQDRGLTAFCDALTFSGLRDELPRLAEPGITVLAPTNEAFAQLSDSARADQRLVRQLLLGHICPGRSTFADIQAKHCAVAVAGQTHACYAEEGYTFVGTSRLLRTDLSFDGGVVHELATCLTVLSLMRDAHSEQVWKKALQPAPLISTIGGVSALGVEFEIHGCLLHAATGQLVPEALRGHVRQIKPVNDEQRLTFGDIVIMTKPPSLAKRRGAAGAPDGSNRYRLLFSIWNTTSLSYISWQHMATPLVVRNSFHMLPLEEKNYRRAQYTIARGGGNSSKKIKDDFDSLPIVPEGESQHGESGAQGHAELGLSAFSAMDEHGYSLAEYTAELKDSLGSAGNAFDAVNATDAQSDLQLQHQEMAAMLKRERLSSSLSKRPSMELLQQRNILPDAERWRVGASKLETSFANRPQMQFLQERNILPHAAKEGGEEVLAKRKRLESFLVHRPTLEQVQATIGVAAEGVADMAVADVNVAGADPLASPLDDPKNEVTLEDALGVFISDNSFRQADDHSLHVDDLYSTRQRDHQSDVT